MVVLLCGTKFSTPLLYCVCMMRPRINRFMCMVLLPNVWLLNRCKSLKCENYMCNTHTKYFAFPYKPVINTCCAIAAKQAADPIIFHSLKFTVSIHKPL